jgi:hypothetical protein
MATQYLALPAYAQLSDADGAAMTDLYRRGMPPNCLAQCKGSAGGGSSMTSKSGSDFRKLSSSFSDWSPTIG